MHKNDIIKKLQSFSNMESGNSNFNGITWQSPRPLIPAAVLVPLVLHNDGITILLTKRAAGLNDHPGQISFPGGRVEDSDKNHMATAIREANEEIGIAIEDIKPIAELTPYIIGTGFIITPIIAFLTPPFNKKAEPSEVEEIFEVPLDFFMDSNNHQHKVKKFNNMDHHYHAIDYKQYYIWGATADMIVNLVNILSESKAND